MTPGGSIPQDRDSALQVRSAGYDLAQSRHIENLLHARIGAEHHESSVGTSSYRIENRNNETETRRTDRTHITEIGPYVVHTEGANVGQFALQVFLLRAAGELPVKLKDAELIPL